MSRPRLPISITLAATAWLSCSAMGGASASETKIKLVETGLLPIAAKTIGVPASIDDRMRAYGVPGISIAIVDEGKIAWAKGYGVADSSSRRPVTTQTLFQAASISKPLSAMGALLMVQKGLLRLDDDVNAALDSWTIPANDFTRASPVTLRMLLNHTSGAAHSGLTHQMLSPGLGNRGLGPAISGTGDFIRFGHDGFNEGFESSFVAYVNAGRGAVVMANSGFAFMLLKEILDSVRLVYEWPAYTATTQQPPAANIGQQMVVPISRQTLMSTVGTYKLDEVATIKLYRQRKRLFLDWPSNGVAEMFATSDGRLFCPQLAFSDVGTPWLRPLEDHHGATTRIIVDDRESVVFRRVN